MIYEEILTLDTLPSKCILFFKSNICPKCNEQKVIFENDKCDLPIYVADELNGSVLGNHFSALVVPLVLVIQDKEEISRHYGVNAVEKILRGE